MFLASTGSNSEQRSIRTSLSGGRVEHGLQPVEVLEQHGLVWQQTLLRSTSCAHAQTRQEAAGFDVHKELGNLLEEEAGRRVVLQNFVEDLVDYLR